jgi:predicted nucleic acid-binding protein
MLVLVDTNVILRVLEPQHGHHSHAVGSLRILKESGFEPCLVPQIHYEFWVAASRPLAANGLGMTTMEVNAELQKLGPPLFRFFRDERAVYDRWYDLVAQHNIQGKAAHDARLVAAMQRHGITQILTFNASDFTRFGGVEVLNAASVHSSA